ncbi:hypothetical protein GAMM_170084 [Gammaproteobacteria bacterium]
MTDLSVDRKNGRFPRGFMIKTNNIVAERIDINYHLVLSCCVGKYKGPD